MIYIKIEIKEINGSLDVIAMARSKDKTERENKLSLAIAHTLEDLKVKDALEHKEKDINSVLIIK